MHGWVVGAAAAYPWSLVGLAVAVVSLQANIISTYVFCLRSLEKCRGIIKFIAVSS